MIRSYAILLDKTGFVSRILNLLYTEVHFQEKNSQFILLYYL